MGERVAHEEEYCPASAAGYDWFGDKEWLQLLRRMIEPPDRATGAFGTVEAFRQGNPLLRGGPQLRLYSFKPESAPRAHRVSTNGLLQSFPRAIVDTFVLFTLSSRKFRAADVAGPSPTHIKPSL